MREIKFRAWDKINKEMVKIDGSVLYVADGKVYEVEERTWAYQSYMHKEDVSSRYELMQYTGLKDKNGKEICEGDILKVYDDFFRDGLDDEYGVVKFENGRFYIDTFKKYPNECFCHFEIIGNIYKNPELMEVENE